MATSKNTTKAAKKATEVKTLEQLKTELIAKQTDLIDAKRGHKAGELANPRVITTTRKEIARLHTAISQAKLSGTERLSK